MLYNVSIGVKYTLNIENFLSVSGCQSRARKAPLIKKCLQVSARCLVGTGW